MNTKRFVQDDDCHWYLIPAEDYGMFVVMSENCNSGVCTDIEFIDKWDQYRCNHPTCYEVIVKEEG